MNEIVKRAAQFEKLGTLPGRDLITRPREFDRNVKADPAGMGHEPDHPIAKIDGLLEIMRNEEDGRVRRAGDVEDLVLQGLASHGVERAEGLVHHQRRRLLSKAASDLQALLHSA